MASLWDQLQSASKSISEQAQVIAGTIDDLTESFVTKVNEASSEMKAEHEKMIREQAKNGVTEVLLPWETRAENKSILVNVTQAMASILELSSHEDTFTQPPDHMSDFTFDFQLYIPVVLRLLEIDANLAAAHFATRMKEEVFWHNYFMHTRVVRQQVGLNLHDDLFPTLSSAAENNGKLTADNIGGGERRLSLLGNEPPMTSGSEEDEEDSNDLDPSDFDLSDDDFEAVNAEDIDEELLEQEIAKELEQDDAL